MEARRPRRTGGILPRSWGNETKGGGGNEEDTEAAAQLQGNEHILAYVVENGPFGNAPSFARCHNPRTANASPKRREEEYARAVLPSIYSV